MFGRKKLREENEDLKEELRVVRASIPKRIEAALEDARKTHSTQYADTCDRTEALARKLKHCEASLREKDRQIRAQQRMIDDLTGMDNPAIEAGTQWQESREDKPRPLAGGVTDAAPGGRLPLRRRGEVAR